MNLGVVSPKLDAYGGSEVYLLECISRWQRDHSITVYTPYFSRKLFREFGIDKHVEVVKLPGARSRRGRLGLLDELLILPRIWEQAIGHHDVYLLHMFPTNLVRRRPSVWFASEPFRPVYDLRYQKSMDEAQVTIHVYPKPTYDRISMADLNALLQLIEEVDAAAPFDRMATHCHGTARYLENVYERKAECIAYPGVSTGEPNGPPDSFDQILFVGRLWQHKRVDLVLKALALIDPRARLSVAGDGPELPALRRLARRLGIGKRVRFLGDVSNSERDRLFRDSLCGVYTPVREPFGIMPLEAAAASRPVVVTAGGGYGEILTADAAHFVPANEGAIAAALHELMAHPRKALEMGREGRRLVEPYTWDRTAATMLEFLQETAERPKAAASRRRGPERVPQLGAHYYPWYRAGKNPVHWGENAEFAGITDLPVGGEYSSGSVRLIDSHLRLAERAGLDFFLVNWQVDFRGVSKIERTATRKLFDRVESTGSALQLAILLAFDTEEPEVVKDALRSVCEEFLEHPAYVRRDRPLLWFYVNDPLLGFLFQHYDDLQRLCRGVKPLATGRIGYNKFMPRHLRRFFRGWSVYSPLEVGPQAQWEQIWNASYRDYVEDDGDLHTFTVCPGFDDKHLRSANSPDSRGSRIARRGLRTYQRMQECALGLEPRPDYVVVTSFNEFHENTHIEPSERYGDTYLESTQRFKAQLVGGVEQREPRRSTTPRC